MNAPVCGPKPAASDAAVGTAMSATSGDIRRLRMSAEQQ